MLTGFTTTIVGGRTQISQGNPDLKPERSTSFDVGAEWTSRDHAIRRHGLPDGGRRTASSRTSSISNPPPPDPIVVSVANGLDAHISGLDLEAEQRLGGRVGVFANTTHYFNRKERLASGAEQDILNVADATPCAPASTSTSGGSARGCRDATCRAARTTTSTRRASRSSTTTTSRSSTRARPTASRGSTRSSLAINNLFDAFYYEKLGYPLQGASFKLSYRLGF